MKGKKLYLHEKRLKTKKNKWLITFSLPQLYRMNWFVSLSLWKIHFWQYFKWSSFELILLNDFGRLLKKKIKWFWLPKITCWLFLELLGCRLIEISMGKRNSFKHLVCNSLENSNWLHIQKLLIFSEIWDTKLALNKPLEPLRPNKKGRETGGRKIGQLYVMI